MPTEDYLREKVRQKLKADGWCVWFPARVKYYENDIFSVFDCIGWSGAQQRLIQVSTLKNKSARVRKIRAYMDSHGLSSPSGVAIEFWGWCDRTKTFRILPL